MKVVTYDMEMLCWDDKEEVGDIIEIAAVLVDLRTGQINKEYSVLVKPDSGLKVSSFCTELTGITQRMVDKQGVDLTEAMRRLHKQISPKHPWYAWGKDRETLQRECAKHSIDIEPSNYHNIAPLIRMMYQKNRALGQREVCENLGLEVVTPCHRALPDAVTLGRIVAKLFGGEPRLHH